MSLVDFLGSQSFSVMIILGEFREIFIIRGTRDEMARIFNKVMKNSFFFFKVEKVCLWVIPSQLFLYGKVCFGGFWKKNIDTNRIVIMVNLKEVIIFEGFTNTETSIELNYRF